MKLLVVLLLVVIFTTVFTFPKQNDVEGRAHYFSRKVNPEEVKSDNPENDAKFWIDGAQARLLEQLKITENKNKAKNVILLMGDGMSLATVTATRRAIANENHILSFERFPHSALSKTYCVDSQVADSACTSTAYLCGVKGNIGTVGVTGAVPLADCSAMAAPANRAPSIAAWAQRAGLRTGLVTTTRVTHASPAGVYGHTAQRYWESDEDVNWDRQDPAVCADLARQLVEGDTGAQLNVVLGGGRMKFLPETEEGGQRQDGRDLVAEWQLKHNGTNAKYVGTKSELLALDGNVEHVLGLFNADHMTYHLDKTDAVDEPSLEEMTEAAIKILSGGKDGFFLFVEGGRIDTAHHEAKTHKALDEAIEFTKAVQKAVDLTNGDETLIVVTSDHSHTMTISGYPVRGSDIFGFGGDAIWNRDDDGNQFLTLNYANGPGQKDDYIHVDAEKLKDKDFPYPAVFPLESETHGGDDVAIYAQGPWSHLFQGVLEENVIPHLMAYAACVGDGQTACDGERPPGGGASAPHLALAGLVPLIAAYFAVW